MKLRMPFRTDTAKACSRVACTCSRTGTVFTSTDDSDWSCALWIHWVVIRQCDVCGVIIAEMGELVVVLVWERRCTMAKDILVEGRSYAQASYSCLGCRSVTGEWRLRQNPSLHTDRMPLRYCNWPAVSKRILLQNVNTTLVAKRHKYDDLKMEVAELLFDTRPFIQDM
jgi:hypothetical protein